MSTFPLEIVTMDGKIFEGNVQRIILRTVHGDVAIMANHTDYCTAIGMGVARVMMEDGKERNAACIGGMLSVIDKNVHVIPTTWEWSDDIDIERAKAAKEKAEQRLADESLSKEARARAEAKLRRALVRISTGGR